MSPSLTSLTSVSSPGKEVFFVGDHRATREEPRFPGDRLPPVAELRGNLGREGLVGPWSP